MSVRAAHVVSGLCTLGGNTGRLVVVSTSHVEPRGLDPGAGIGRQLALGADRQRHPVGAALHAAGPVDDPRRGRGRPANRPREPATRLPWVRSWPACMLTRHVAIGLTLAVLLDLALRRRWPEALTVAAVAAIFVSPWLSLDGGGGIERPDTGRACSSKVVGHGPGGSDVN